MKKEKLRKEVEEKVIGIKSKGHIRERNKFPAEFISSAWGGVVLISKVFSHKV